jgi:hypothetical protein
MVSMAFVRQHACMRGISVFRQQKSDKYIYIYFSVFVFYVLFLVFVFDKSGLDFEWMSPANINKSIGYSMLRE